MVQKNKEKQLVLQDLCIRLPYGVKGLINGCKCTIYPHDIEDFEKDLRTITPYLRPMSSMTEEDNLSLSKYVGCSIRAKYGEIYFPNIEDNTLENWEKIFEWLLKNHFDFRGLIEKGLAIEVTEGNNPYR
jgi:hypothetical protein